MATQPRPAKPQISTADLVVSIIAIVLLAAFELGAAATGFMMLAFTDYCPPDTCSIEDALTALGTALVAGFAGYLAAVGG